MSIKIHLEPGKYYHIYNHAIGNDVLFKSDTDYNNFIYKYIKYISPIVYTISYCLMPNHFHFCIRIKEYEEIDNIPDKYKNNVAIKAGIFRCFSHFFNSYAQSYNNKYDRMGGLFISNFKRKEVTTDNDIRRLVYYIHNNPVEEEIVENPEDYLYSSAGNYCGRIGLMEVIVI